MEEAKNWRVDAACLNEDPEQFFPIGEKSVAAKWWIEEAKIVCGRCAVRQTCLNWALEKNQDHGVWGGMSESERRALKRRKQRSKLE